MVSSHTEALQFGSMKGGEVCDYDHTLVEDSSAQGGGKEDCSVGQKNVNIRKVEGCCHSDAIDAVAH